MYIRATLSFVSVIASILLCFAAHAGTASGHAPIGVMADHMHKAGEYMLSYRFMNMDGSRINNNKINSLTTATIIPNRFFGRPGQPLLCELSPPK